MRIELFGIARLRAGRSALEVRASSVDQALRAAARRCPGLEPDVIDRGTLGSAFVLSLNGERFLPPTDRRLDEGDVLLVLDAHAGG